MKNIKLLVLIMLIGINTLAWAQCDDEIIATYPPPTNTGDQRGNLPHKIKIPKDQICGIHLTGW